MKKELRCKNSKNIKDLKNKAQISMEYLVIFTIAIIMTLPLIVIYVTQSNNVNADVTNVEVYRIASKIADYSEEVYFMGEPAQRTYSVDFPEGITNVTLQENIIIFNVTTTDLTYLVMKDTLANLSGTIRPFSGKHIITFKATSNGVLIIDK